MSQGKHSRIWLVVTSFIFVAISILLIFNKQYIVDQITVWQFSPSSAIRSLADRSGMNDYGRFIYFASQPVLEPASDFNKVCDRLESTTSILGCYSKDRIYLYDINNAELDGVREVTAAHETLHAAYIRLVDGDKDRVDLLFEAEYKKLENNKDFADRMAFYSRTEPGQRDNELHSVIGTEVANISPELEAYYGRYFSDRQKIVALNTKYIGVFQSLSNRANELKIQLNSLGLSISNGSDQYNRDVATLNSDISVFNNKANNGLFSSESQFNSARSLLSARVDSLNLTRISINKDSDKYNSLLVEFNSIASESKKLYNSIDSTLVPAPSI